jgi:transcriptional regulator with XRE-family HTH domain
MDQDICILVGRRIRDNRLRRGWRQIDLAEHADISETYVSELELGRSEACLRTLHAIAKAFGLSLGELFAKI